MPGIELFNEDIEKPYQDFYEVFVDDQDPFRELDHKGHVF